MPVTHVQSKQQLTKGFLTAALFGRLYDLDDGPHPTVKSSASHIPGHLITVCLLAVKAYLHFEGGIL